MIDVRVLELILVSAAITFFLRAFPFAVFSGERKMPKRLESLGKILPSAIMAVLIVYCLKDAARDFSGVGIKQIMAVAAVIISYKIKHNTFLSILLGTVLYMMMLRIGA